MPDIFGDYGFGDWSSPDEVTMPEVTGGFGDFGNWDPNLGMSGGELGGLLGNLGLADIFKILNLGVGGAGAFGSLFGQGGAQSQTPQTSTPQKAALNQLQQMAGGMAGTQQGLFNQGAGMLSALGQGQIPAGLTNLVNAAYDPYMQQMGTQAIEASRRAGFALPQDAFTGGPGGAVMGPAMAQLPGMKAQTTLNTMFPLIQALMGQGQQGLQGLQGAANAWPTGQQNQQQPSIAQRVGGMGPFLSQIGQVLGMPTQPGPQGQPPANISGLSY